MSTRTNVTIEYGDSRVILSRHCDGYPACTGGSILRALIDNKAAHRAVSALIAECYDATQFCPARPIYELTTSIHGDIEHEYLVRFDVGTGKLDSLAHRRRLNWSDDPAAWPPWKLYTLADFAELVNRERAWMNARIRERGLPYTEDDLFEMLEVCAEAI